LGEKHSPLFSVKKQVVAANDSQRGIHSLSGVFLFYPAGADGPGIFYPTGRETMPCHCPAWPLTESGEGSSSFCVDLIYMGIKPTQNDKKTKA